MINRTAELRRLLAEERFIDMPVAYDPLGGRLISNAHAPTLAHQPCRDRAETRLVPDLGQRWGRRRTDGGASAPAVPAAPAAPRRPRRTPRAASSRVPTVINSPATRRAT